MLHSPKILLIDDDEDDRLLITEAFKSTNLDVQITEATSGTDALAMIELMRPLPSLIVVDMNMPGMAGTETIEKLRVILDKAPIVLLTTSLTGDLAIEAIELGANACFNKPMSFNDMCSLANQLHRRFLQH